MWIGESECVQMRQDLDLKIPEDAPSYSKGRESVIRSGGEFQHPVKDVMVVPGSGGGKRPHHLFGSDDI